MNICAIIINYQNTAATQACLRSLIGQGLQAVIVVDNSANRDFENELAGMIEGQLRFVDFSMRLINPNCNLGFGRGVNLALHTTQELACDAFLLINNDAQALPGMLFRLAAELGHLRIPMVAPSVIDLDGVGQPMLWYQRFFGTLTKQRLPGSFPYLSGCCLLVNIDACKDGKLFDEDFFMYGEDTLLGWRLACEGLTPHTVAEVFVRHRGTGSSRQGQVFYEYHVARAHVLLASKTWRYEFERPILLTCKFASLALRACWRSLRFASFIPLKAYYMAWRKHDIRVP